MCPAPPSPTKSHGPRPIILCVRVSTWIGNFSQGYAVISMTPLAMPGFWCCVLPRMAAGCLGPLLILLLCSGMKGRGSGPRGSATPQPDSARLRVFQSVASWGNAILPPAVLLDYGLLVVQPWR